VLDANSWSVCDTERHWGERWRQEGGREEGGSQKASARDMEDVGGMEQLIPKVDGKEISWLESLWDAKTR
jgi:hypothetical protein